MKIGHIPETGAAQFTLYAKLLMDSRGRLADAAHRAELAGAEKMASMLSTAYLGARVKEAVLAGSTVGWGSPLAQYQAMVSEFEASLRSKSVFDAALSAMRNVPLGLARLTYVASVSTGQGVSQGAPKPVSSLQLGAGDIEPTKAVFMFVVSKDVGKLETSQTLLADELRSGVAAATDTVFVPGLIDSSTPNVTAGSDFLADLAEAIESLSLSARSRLFLGVSPRIAARLAMMEGDAFGEMTAAGGVIRGVQIVPTDAIEHDSSGSRLVLFDAAQIAASTGTIVLDASEEAMVQMDSAPVMSPTASTVAISLWQQNLLGMKGERYFAFKRLRPTAVATITGADYSV